MFGKPPAKPIQTAKPQPLKTYYRLVACPICKLVKHIEWEDERTHIECNNNHTFAIASNVVSPVEVVRGIT